MRGAIVSLLACAGLVGCAPTRPLSRVELEPTPPRRLALAVAEHRRTIVVDGVSIAIHDSDPTGAKPTIIGLHAIGHGGGDFASFEQAFRDRFRVITVDWPGHGASGQDARPASAQRYAALLLGLIGALDLDQPILFGNSIGGAAVRCHRRGRQRERPPPGGGMDEFRPSGRRPARRASRASTAGVRRVGNARSPRPLGSEPRRGGLDSNRDGRALRELRPCSISRGAGAFNAAVRPFLDALRSPSVGTER